MASQQGKTTMDAAWQAVGSTSAGSGAVAGELERFDALSLDGIRDELYRLEAAALGSGDPLMVLRRALADLVDRKLSSERLHHLSMASTDADPDPAAESLSLLIADCEIQIAVLRCYCRQQFGDGHERDWFLAYQALSALFQGRIGGGSPDRSAEDVFRFDGETWRMNRESFRGCRDRCLGAPVGKQFAALETSA
ncbi:MAG: hypothetical protein ACOWWM_07220 [Desulfobacterales bacterium]